MLDRLIRRTIYSFAALLLLSGLSAAAAAAAPAPVWKIAATSQPTNIPSGSKLGHLLVVATNVGAAAAEGEITLSAELPAGITPENVFAESKDSATGEFTCSISGQELLCTSPGPVHPGFHVYLNAELRADAPNGSSLTAHAEVGGAAAVPAAADAEFTISSALPEFDFLPGAAGFRAVSIADDGAAATLSGSSPYDSLIEAHFPTIAPEGFFTGAGHLKDLSVDLPPGLLADPAATGTRCTEAQLTSEHCPDSAQVGIVRITTKLLGLAPEYDFLYNMVPPPGSPAAFGFNALGVGIFPHILASIRTESDYGATGTSSDILARGLNPLLDVSVELWGDPSDHSHDLVRACSGAKVIPIPCKISPDSDAFVSLPTRCDGQPLSFTARADSWEEPGVEHEVTYQSSDLENHPVALTGCNGLAFQPTLSLAPTTNLADSPSGLDVELHQPQETKVGGRSTAQLRNAVVQLPEGLVVNPSQADGLGACSPAQIGMLTEVGQVPAHFRAAPSACPNSAKIGTVAVTTPLLAQYNERQEPERDPETGNVIPEPLHGSVYLATPFQNPFGSLLAIYLTVEDAATGTYAKIPGLVEADPQTGRLTTRFTDNPQLPLEDIKLHLFEGPRGALVTPPSCGTHTTTTTLTPWSAPEGADAHPESSFTTTAQPGGGTCPTSADTAPNAPSFVAGTLSPAAGAYSPFVLKISREDGSQRITGIDTTLPPGLSGKLAGIAECSDAQIAQAAARSHPDEGTLERQSPSCPDSTRVGSVVVAAGAGPTPYYTEGNAYLAGPYRGAPLSLATIVPAIAGPFDLGTVVTRVALHVEPETAQIHAVSDPLPTILDGIPLDVRSIALKMDRPDFTINPTSCDPMTISGSLTSAFGQVASVKHPFQVGACSALPFKPKLSLRLKGSVKRSSNPKLIANLTARPGEANIARAQVKLPHAVFLDQAHIRTICTRVQFAADTCPSGSVYGRAKAQTPLLGYPLSGPVYLRSSSHQLPDLVAKLKGPAWQPIEIDLVGKTDAVKAALRNTFEAVPDAPVSHFRLELFGGKRGLVEMSDGFCAARRATVKLDGQNGKVHDTRPVVAATCRQHKNPKKRRGGHHRGARKR